MTGAIMSGDYPLHQRGERETDEEGSTDARRRPYRLTVYRIAQDRLRDELAIGLTRSLAAWIALRETGACCSLTPRESAHLLTSLLAAAERADRRP